MSFSQKVHFSDNTSVEHLEDDEDLEIVEEPEKVERIIPSVSSTSPKRRMQGDTLNSSEPLMKKTKADAVKIIKVIDIDDEPSVRKSKPNETLPSQPPSTVNVQNQCGKCPEIFSTMEQLSSHSCKLLTDRSVNREKRNYVENSVRKEDTLEEIILDEAVIVRINENIKTGFDMRPPLGDKPSKPNTVKPSMATHPFESFLETVIVEETEGFGRGDTERSIQNLQQKYKKGARKVDFTKSPFFMKNAELLGGKSSGGGFKEEVNFLPPNWRVKTYSEWKKFYLTPQLIVLKSGAAVIEYVRLSYDLSNEDLKTLADCLAISSRVFNKYLDQLFDDCVVLD